MASSDSALSPDLRRVLAEAARGDAAQCRWALQRETRRASDSTRVVRIEKAEIASGFLDLPGVPTALRVHDGMPEPVTAADPQPLGQIRTVACFDASDPATLKQQKGDSLVAYVQTRNGKPVTPAKQNFALSCEPYETEFRPVYTYSLAGREYAQWSPIGRRGGPTLALALFAPCLLVVAAVDEANVVTFQFDQPDLRRALDIVGSICDLV